jgi:MYXO-CTERM domain-containing protein
MPFGQEKFNLDSALAGAWQAFQAVVCHIGFEAALHGLAFAVVLGLAGLVFIRRRQRFGRPLLAVCWKLSLFCLVLMLPGVLTLVLSGQLPPTGTLKISSLGFMAFWSLISLHLSAEEMNFQWF